MCITTGNNTCDAMAKLHLCGNIIPQIWHKTIVSEKTGKADLIAINILADIAYWYRPAEERDELTGETVGYHPKFAADILQRSYDDLADRPNALLSVWSSWVLSDGCSARFLSAAYQFPMCSF